MILNLVDAVIPYLERYQCQQLPNDKTFTAYQLPVIFGLVEPKDDGCAILDYLVNLQNNSHKKLWQSHLELINRSLKFLDDQTVVLTSKIQSTKQNTTYGYNLQSMC